MTILLLPLLEECLQEGEPARTESLKQAHRLFLREEARDATDCWKKPATYNVIASLLARAWQESAQARTAPEREAATLRVRQASEIVLFARRWPEVRTTWLTDSLPP
jgi:hypothetical protein